MSRHAENQVGSVKLPVNQPNSVNPALDPSLSSRMTAYACGLVVTAAMIIFFGLIMLYSATYQKDGAFYFHMQLFWLAAGTALGVAAFAVGYRTLAEYSPLVLAVLVCMLLAAYLCYPPTNGAYRWIKLEIGSFRMSIQPSEFVKVFVPLYVGKYCGDNFRHIQSMFSRHGAWNPFMVIAIMCAMILLGHDLGTTLLVFAVGFLILFVAGLRTRYYLIPLTVGVAGFFIIKAFDRTRWDRLTVFLDPEKFSGNEGYQLWSSLLALGSGSWTGLGFMAGRMKTEYLPEKHTDFILAVIGEELGLAALVAILLGYLVLTCFALKISCNARTKQGVFTGFGISITIILQALINIGVVSGALPTKGIPAPLLSYGGSGLVMMGISIGVLLNIAADTASPDLNKRFWAKFKRKKWRTAP